MGSVQDRIEDVFSNSSGGSALECAAVLDELQVMRAFDEAETKEGKALLHRIVSMLTKMTEPVEGVREYLPEYGFSHEEEKEVKIDYDYAHEHGKTL